MILFHQDNVASALRTAILWADRAQEVLRTLPLLLRLPQALWQALYVVHRKKG
jgi:hypothetical protein